MGKQIPVESIVENIPAIWDIIIETRKAIINRDGFLYACDFETRLNLDLLDSLSTDPKNVSTKSPAFKIFKTINLNTRLKNIKNALREVRGPLKKVIEANEKRTMRCWF